MFEHNIYRRRTRESDTGTDDDTTRFDSGSPASSDSLFQTRISSEEPLEPIRSETFTEDASTLKCKHTDETQPKQHCQSCGAGTATPQYIPIPVPVPIPFPVPAALWTNQEAFTMFGSQANMTNLDQTIASRLRVVPRNLWPYYTQAALIWPLINNTSADGASAPATGDFGTLNSVLQTDHSTTAGTTTMPPVAIDRDNSQSTTACSNKTNTETNDHKDDPDESNNNAVIVESVDETEEITGYLECENRYVSSSDSSRDSSDSSDTSGNENRKPCVRRVYNVNCNDSDRQSDDALPSSNVTSDCDEDGRNSHSSVREYDMSSSGSADTDSDDTGTVADRKTKKFSRIFVVNKNISSSSNASSVSSDTDTSDNDTDTEMDCTVILTNIKPIDENFSTKILIAKTNSVDDLKIIKDKDFKQILNCDNQRGDKISEELNNLVTINDEINPECETNISHIKDREYMSSSPGLSDVSAESLNSSDVEHVREYTIEIGEENDKEHYCNDNNDKLCNMDVSEKTKQLQVGYLNDQYIDENDKEKDDNNINIDTIDTDININIEDYRQANEINFVEDSVTHETDIDKNDNGVILAAPESEAGVQDGRNRRRFSEWNNKIRSNDDIKVGDTTVNTRDQAGGPTTLVSSEYSARNAARYTSLVMITQEPAPSYQQVNVVTSDTTTFVPDQSDVIVQHTNWQDGGGKKNNIEEKLNGKSHIVLLCTH